MYDQPLGKIEKKLKKSFSASEIQSLLQRDEQQNVPKKFDEFFEEYASVISRHFPSENPKEDFKKALMQRLQKVKDFIYFKELEESLSTKVDRRIRRTVSSVRGQLEDALGRFKVGKNLQEKIRDIRNMSTQDILEGKVKIDELTMVEYIALVQKELKRQILKIQKLDTPDMEPGPENRDVFEKSMNLIQFLVAQVDLPETTKRYVRAHLYRKLRSKDGWRYIRNLYQDRYLFDEDSEQARAAIQSLIQNTEKVTREGRDEHIFEILRQYVPDIDLSPGELESMRQFGVRQQGDITYDQLIAGRLEEIEHARIEMELEQMMPEPNQRNVELCQNIIAREAKSLRQGIESFREEKYTIEYLVGQIPEESADEFEKSQLISAGHFLKDHLGIPQQSIRLQISNLQTPEDVQQFLEIQERKLEQYLQDECTPPFSAEDLELLRKNDPGLNLFEVLTNQARFQNQSKPDESPSGEYLEGESLTRAEEALKIMQEIAIRQFPESEMKRFQEAEKTLEEIFKKETYKVKEWKMSKKLKLTPEDIANDEMEEVELPQRLPPHLQTRYAAVQQLKSNIDRFGKARKEILKIHDFKDEAQLRAGLSAFYLDFFEIKGEKPQQAKKLTKVMTFDHPITTIRFNAANQRPFDASRGIYDFHKLDNLPATYKQRAASLMKEVQQMLQAGDYTRMFRLFESGGKADRLYLDSIFFPTSAITNTATRESILYDTLSSGKETGEKVQVLSAKIPKIYRDAFKDFEDPESEAHAKALQAAAEDKELQALPDTLAHDQDFLNEFENVPVPNGLEFHDDGSVSLTPEGFEELPSEMRADLRQLHPEVFERVGGEVKGVGAASPDDLRIPPETIKKIAEKYPLIAGRAAQFNSIARGTAIAGVEYAGRAAADVVRLPFQTAASFGRVYWKNLRFYSAMSIYVGITEFYEHIANLADFRVKFKAYTLLKDTFAGTIIGSEFAKLQQSKENERVDSFKGALAQYGNEDIIDKLYNARDRFELKAVLIEGFENRGLFTIEDILKNDFFKLVNKHTPSKVIPLKYTEEEMLSDPDKKSEMTNHVREALDNLWGGGTWVGWRSAGASKYASKQKEAFENFKNNTGAEKMKVYSQYWEWLKQPDDGNPLKNITPAELVGNIENDMLICNNDSGETYAIFQALISRGYIKLEHLTKFQDAHGNDMPSYVFQEPEQARLSGLTAHIEKALKDDRKYKMGENPIMQFYQGRRALDLKGMRAGGKWSFPKKEKDFKEAEEKGEIISAALTVHQLQKSREPQPKGLHDADNGFAGIFIPAYEIQQIEQAYRPDAQGNIDIRPHDAVAAYRGIHDEFSSYMQAMNDPIKDETGKVNVDDFKRSMWYAYVAICKTMAFASYFAQHRSKKYDYPINTLGDPSPNLDMKITEKRGPSGTSNFERLIIKNTGRTQRMGESSEILDKLDISDELRLRFKKMAGYQFIDSLGVDSNGKEGGRVVPYRPDTYHPAEHFPKVIKAFMDDVLGKAEKAGILPDIQQSFEKSKMADFSVNNDTRQEALNIWAKKEAMLT